MRESTPTVTGRPQRGQRPESFCRSVGESRTSQSRWPWLWAVGVGVELATPLPNESRPHPDYPAATDLFETLAPRLEGFEEPSRFRF